MSIDWTQIAPHRDDWPKVNKLFDKAGLPERRWRNGEPLFAGNVDQKKLEAVAHEYGSKRHRNKK